MKKIIINKWPLPGDLLVATAIALLTLAFTLHPEHAGLALRVPVGLCMALFLPGYVLTSAIFPRKDDLGGIERVALSIGMSISIVPLIGMGLNYTHWGIRPAPVAISLAIFAVVMAVVAYIRLLALDPEERFSIGFKRDLRGLRQEILPEKTSKLDKALAIFLILAIIFSAIALIFVAAGPKTGEKFTEFYILGPNRTIDDYPIYATAGNSSTVIVGIINHEYKATNYTLELNLENTTIMREDVDLDHNQTWERPVSLSLIHI